jgi:aminocarboxymuconate-semialdehyde decarboxylase
MSGKAPVIDVHAHVTPQRFQAAVADGKDWHGMTADAGELGNPANLWNPARRIEEMDKDGVDIQVVSPTDCFYAYERDPAQTAAIAADANEEMAEMVRDHPTRFRGIGTLPMQDVGLATKEMARSMNELGLSGFMIDDHVNNSTYDEDVFADFWAAAEELGAYILVHQFQPTVVAARTEKYFLLNSIGNLVDRALTFGTLVYGGVMDRHPDLKVVLAHAGGYVPFAIDRIDKGWEMWPEERGKSEAPPSTYIDKFYYDTVTFTERNLRFMIDVVGIDRVVFGTDFPAPMQVVDPVRWIETVDCLTDAEREAILRTNPAKMLGIGDRALEGQA